MPEALLDAENLFIPLAREAAGAGAAAGAARAQYVHECCQSLDALAAEYLGGEQPRISFGKTDDLRVAAAHSHLRTLGWWLVDVPDGPDEADLAIRRRLEGQGWADGPYLLASADRANVVDPTIAQASARSAGLRARIVVPPDAERLRHALRHRGTPAGIEVVSFAQTHRRWTARVRADRTRRGWRCRCVDVRPGHAEPGRPDLQWFAVAAAMPVLDLPDDLTEVRSDGWRESALLAAREYAWPAGASSDLRKSTVERLRSELPVCARLVAGPLAAEARRAVAQVALLLPEARRSRGAASRWDSVVQEQHPELVTAWRLATVLVME